MTERKQVNDITAHRCYRCARIGNWMKPSIFASNQSKSAKLRRVNIDTRYQYFVLTTWTCNRFVTKLLEATMFRVHDGR